MNKIDSALEVMSHLGDKLARTARESGDADTAFAFEAVANMLTSMANRYTSPLLDAKYATLSKVGNGLDYDRALDRALALACWRMRSFHETKYRASQTVAEVSGIHQKRLASFLPRDINSAEGRELVTRLDHLIAQLDQKWRGNGDDAARLEQFELEIDFLAERSRRWDVNVERLQSMMTEKGKTFEGRPFVDPAAMGIGLKFL